MSIKDLVDVMQMPLALVTLAGVMWTIWMMLRLRQEIKDVRREMHDMHREFSARMDRMEFHSKLSDSVLVTEHRMQKQTYMAFWQEPPLDEEWRVGQETAAVPASLFPRFLNNTQYV